jgi:hypothetical protein
MKPHLLVLGVFTAAITLITPHSLAQTSVFEPTAPEAASLSAGDASTSAALVSVPPRITGTNQMYRPFSGLGLASRVGIAGAGFDFATPLVGRFNLRTGMDLFSYTTSFQEEGATVGMNLRLSSEHAALDWFPFGGHLRVSPQMIFGNNNRILARAVIPPGSTLTLNGQNYASSFSDPLRGAARVDFRKVSPGFSFGLGNFFPRDRSRFSIPVEMGFYYVGQPSLQVAFTGSACESGSMSVCESVGQDPGFQQSLAAFKARNDHNLNYASFFPIFSVGVGYRIW